MKSLFFALLGIGLACLAAEAALRFTDPTDFNRFHNDPKSGLLTYQPNYTFTQSQSCFSNMVTTNRFGLHAPEPPTGAKEPDEFRIVVAGSSIAEAVDEPNELTPSGQLQALLNADPNRKYRYEVIPVAFSGNNTYLSILYYLNYGRPLNPDLIIDITIEYEVTHNIGANYDPRFATDGSLITTLPQNQQSGLVVTLKNILRQSKLVQNLKDRYLVLSKTNLFAAPAPQAPKAAAAEDTGSAELPTAQNWAIEKKLYAAFAGFAAEDKAKFLIASWTSDRAATSTVTELHDALTESAAMDGFSYLDMDPSFSMQEAQTGKGPIWPCDGHWSDVGSHYAAETMYEYLKAHPALITKQP